MDEIETIRVLEIAIDNATSRGDTRVILHPTRAKQILAALEAAREDACVALVADIRFACGDNGKRMQPELVEFIRRLAADAERLDYVMSHVRGSELRRIGIHTNGGDHRPAIDQARGKAGGEVGS